MTKEARIYNRGKTISAINDTGKNWTAPCKRIKLLQTKM